MPPSLLHQAAWQNPDYTLRSCYIIIGSMAEFPLAHGCFLMATLLLPHSTCMVLPMADHLFYTLLSCYLMALLPQGCPPF